MLSWILETNDSSLLSVSNRQDGSMCASKSTSIVFVFVEPHLGISHVLHDVPVIESCVNGCARTRVCGVVSLLETVECLLIAEGQLEEVLWCSGFGAPLVCATSFLELNLNWTHRVIFYYFKKLYYNAKISI